MTEASRNASLLVAPRGSCHVLIAGSGNQRSPVGNDQSATPSPRISLLRARHHDGAVTVRCTRFASPGQVYRIRKLIRAAALLSLVAALIAGGCVNPRSTPSSHDTPAVEQRPYHPFEPDEAHAKCALFGCQP